MPCLSALFDPSIGPVITIGILPPGIIAPATVPVPPPIMFQALIDTGASVTCISPAIAQTVRLRPIGMRPMISATHSVPVNVYLVDLILDFGTHGLLSRSSQVMEFAPAAGSPFQVLVGRDIICRGTFTMSFDGHFTFCL